MTKCKKWASVLATGVALVMLGLGGCGGDDALAAELDPSEIDDAGEVALFALNQGSPLGTNLAGLSDWNATFPFVDLFHQSRAWISGAGTVWDDGRTLDLDANGWVRSLKAGQIARTRIYGLPGGTPLPFTRLVVLYDGQGTIQYSGGVSRNAQASSAGRDVVDVHASNPSMSLFVTQTNPGNYVRNIRVVPQGGVCSNDEAKACTANWQCGGGAACDAFEEVYETQRFHPLFLARIQRYGTLRFMDWMATNNSAQSTWWQRPRVQHSTWAGGRGMPLEIMVELANRTHSHPWFTLPHLANDNYVRQFARYVRDNLDPSLDAYVEHSNEVWNGIFGQAKYARQRGLALGLSSNQNQAGLRYHSRRSRQIFGMWTTEFGGTSRIVRVMGSHAANKGTSTELLTFESAYTQTDALAIAPYFGGYLGTPARQTQVASMSVWGLLQELQNTAVPQAIGWMNHSRQVAQQRGVDLIAYEGGQHLSGTGGVQNNQTINNLFDAVNRHPGMKQLYIDYLDAWSDHGDLFVHFTDCSPQGKFGRWGAVEYGNQPRAQAPKYDALLTFIETTDAWW